MDFMFQEVERRRRAGMPRQTPRDSHMIPAETPKPPQQAPSVQVMYHFTAATLGTGIKVEKHYPEI